MDSNGFQNDGAINSKMVFEQLKSKWSGFGWNTISCDGHSVKDLLDAFKNKSSDKPTVIVAKTVKGKGVSFMEHKPIWHYRSPTKEEYVIAIKELKEIGK